MADILSRCTPLLVNPDSCLSLSQSELVHFVRPSADLLFESVAARYKDRAIAVVLTGSDGAYQVQRPSVSPLRIVESALAIAVVALGMAAWIARRRSR